MLLALLSCKDPDPPHISRAPPPVAPGEVVDIEEQEVLFSLEAPNTLASSFTIEDFDQDGQIDLLLSVSGELGWTQVLVRGPLAGQRVPSQAWARWELDDWFVWPVEVTGDGVIDLVAYEYATGTSWLSPSPYDGSLPGAGWTALEAARGRSFASDIDRDGVHDLVWDGSSQEEGLEELHIIWGPSTRWDGPPDVIVGPLCRDGETYGYPVGIDGAYFPGDLDSDGQPELSLPAWGYMYGHQDCGDVVVSLPESGTIDPFSSPLAYDRLSVQDGYPIGDWTGDGLAEVWLGGEVLLSPIALGVSLVGSDSVDPEIAGAGVPSFDLGGDGHPDALIVADSALKVVPAEVGLLLDSTAMPGWKLDRDESASTYLEGGHAYAIIAGWRSPAVRRVDLGSAEPL
jgi:hypothetical protein